MVRQLQERFYNNLYQVKMTNPDFTKIAEAYDLFAIRVTKSEELISFNKTVLKIEKDDFNSRFIEIQHYIEKSLIDMSYSEINIYYNHYYSSTTFDFKKINTILR